MTLYHYWRSSSSWRVRWALEFKKLDKSEVKLVHVDLLNGESESVEHLKRNPLGFVPVLEHAGKYLTESRAIVEWLEERFPEKPLLPVNQWDRALVRSLIDVVASDIQPVQNLTVLEKISSDAQVRKEWSQYFIVRGFEAYETLCKSHGAGKFSFGDQVTAADLFLIPQIYNAHRFEIDMAQFPIIQKIYENCLALPEVHASHPDRFAP